MASVDIMYRRASILTGQDLDGLADGTVNVHDLAAKYRKSYATIKAYIRILERQVFVHRKVRFRVSPRDARKLRTGKIGINEISRRLGTSIDVVRRSLRLDYGIERFPRWRKRRNPEKVLRNKAVAAMRYWGMSFGEIAKSVGVTKQRVKQIVEEV